MKLIHRLGSALEPAGTDDFVIAHIVNDRGAWGAGFVIPLGQKFPLAKEWYLKGGLKLGEVQFVPVTLAGRAGWIANMCAQTLGSDRPLYYHKLIDCLEHLQNHSHDVNARIHMPRIGCGLAGGRWQIIANLLPAGTTVYTLPAERGNFPPEDYQIGP